MSLGYDTFEDENRSFEKKGITGQVQRYTRGSMTYPCYIVRSEPDKPVGKHQIAVLKNMFGIAVDKDDDVIYVYFSQGGKLARIGKIQSYQVKAFMRLFNNNYVDCFLDADTELTGDYRYALSN